ncbi:hypothetical protein MES5069_410017 [Mesorhizobium escarrei]|uniref:Uncharacterized protein n=1 Tax=Mesorhizobium escarrei TaxID=666018 RepID=A0ABM9E5H7_9HYPH|nr:hypothetical protein MES5069_410017 [Mesorhizobium escarrei]
MTQSSRKFEGIHVIGALGIGKADKAEHFLGPRLALRPGHGRMNLQGFADLIADRVQRRQRCHRLLKDLADAAASQRSDIGAVTRHLQDILRRAGLFRIGKQDTAANMGRLRQNAHHCLAYNRFSGTGLAYKRGNLAGQDAKICTPDGMQRSSDNGKRDANILDPQQIKTRIHFHTSPTLAACRAAGLESETSALPA